jgi:excisionase family DNA binding protein
MSTPAIFRRWLQGEIKWLQAHEGADDLQVFYDAAHILDQARQRATALGLTEVAKLCRCGAEAVAPIVAQESLSAALAALKPEGKRLTPPQVAKRYGVSPDTVRRWIEAGELKAVNIASKKATRPRHRIEPEALAEFDRKRMAKTLPAKPETKRRSRKPDRFHPILDRYR